MGAQASFLIVDDEPLVRRALVRVFHRYGVCTEASSAADAAELITNGATWSGFVIDVRLGDGSGLDVLASARRFHNAPALVLSASVDRDTVNRAATCDCSDRVSRGTSRCAWRATSGAASQRREVKLV